MTEFDVSDPHAEVLLRFEATCEVAAELAAEVLVLELAEVRAVGFHFSNLINSRKWQKMAINEVTEYQMGVQSANMMIPPM